MFVDTEEEFDWAQPFDRGHRSTTAIAALSPVQARFVRAGVKPVYLVDHPVATNADAVAILRPWMEAGECDIGTHLHPWVNPPFDEEVNQRNSFSGNLDPVLERAKLDVLTDAITASFGLRPTIYRAGRYGVGAHSADLLREAGYEIDVSVRALFDYSSGGGPNFERVPPRPYWIGDGALLELPLTSTYIGPLGPVGLRLRPAIARMPGVPGLLAKSHLLERVALTPEDMPIVEVLKALKRLIDQGVEYFSISFHSPTVEPGHTPYVKNSADLDRFHGWWDGVFDFFARHDVHPAAAQEVLEAARAGRAEA